MNKKTHERIRQIVKIDDKMSGSSAWISDLDSLANNSGYIFNKVTYRKIIAKCALNTLKHRKHLQN